jgi:putative two-component system response regulator
MSAKDLQKILIVDDTPDNIRVLMECLKNEYKTVAATSGNHALKIASLDPIPDIILLDVMMPEMSGYEVCKKLKEDTKTRNIPVIFITALTDAENEAEGLKLGAVDYITKPFNPELVKARIRNQLKLKAYQDNLEELVKQRTHELALAHTVIIESLATLAEYRDPETGGHIKRTQNYVKALAKKLIDHPRFRDELNDEIIELMYLSAPLHDVGKVAIPDHILLKPARLTDEEFEVMKAHTTLGYEALRLTREKLGRNSFLRYACEIAHTHQEKWDGSGYPKGLKGDDIPISGRFMALADVYDALISKRHYKPPFSHEKAVEIILEGKGSHFDPDVVDAFMELQDSFRNIAITFADFDEERHMLATPLIIDDDNCRQVSKVLVVDDSEINLEIMKSQLKARGYTVDTAENGKEALIKIAQNHYDLILTDLEMPEMDGYSLATEIRKMPSEKKRVPIIAVTANDFDLNENSAKAFGFNDYMLKPLEIGVLENKLSRIVRTFNDTISSETTRSD